MGGSGGGGYFSSRTPDEVRSELRKEEERTLDQTFDVEIAEKLGELLADANVRDADAHSAALEQIKKAIEADLEGSVEPRFGGSVRKRTYVDGISDVDMLVILRDPALKSKGPQRVLDYFERKIRKDLADWEISRDNLAVTVKKGNQEIQLLPAVRTEGRTQIAAARSDRWSDINPEAFFRKLSETNERYGRKIVPVIKLAKIINARQPETLQLTGYHLESMAIEAFKGYKGPANPKAMLEHFIDRSRSLVLAPIKDSTGQSVHVDEYLGNANSQDRKAVAATLDRIFRRMKNADVLKSKEQWMELLEEE
jgi:hypothetical protein